MADLLKTWNKAQAPQDAVSLGLAHNRIKRFFHRRRDAYLENLAKEKGKDDPETGDDSPADGIENGHKAAADGSKAAGGGSNAASDGNKAAGGEASGDDDAAVHGDEPVSKAPVIRKGKENTIAIEASKHNDTVSVKGKRAAAKTSTQAAGSTTRAGNRTKRTRAG